jgi:hypothetical protein
VPARVAEWQTQRTQNPPGATPCEFDSRLGHSAGSVFKTTGCILGFTPFLYRAISPLRPIVSELC